MGWPSAFTTRPTSAGPTGTSMMRPVRLTVSPSRTFWSLPKSGDADVVLFEVEHHAHQLAGELDELAGHGAFEAVDAGDTVTDGEHGTGLHHFDGLLVGGDLLLDDLRDLFSAQLHRGYLTNCSFCENQETLGEYQREKRLRRSSSESLRSASRVRTLPSKTLSPTRVTTPAIKPGVGLLLDGDVLAGGLLQRRLQLDVVALGQRRRAGDLGAHGAGSASRPARRTSAATWGSAAMRPLSARYSTVLRASGTRPRA